MKQRTRIRRIKAHMYPGYIQLARQRRQWAEVVVNMRRFSDAMREAYEKVRKEREMSEMREGRQEPSAGEPPR